MAFWNISFLSQKARKYFAIVFVQLSTYTTFWKKIIYKRSYKLILSPKYLLLEDFKNKSTFSSFKWSQRPNFALGNAKDKATIFHVSGIYIRSIFGKEGSNERANVTDLKHAQKRLILLVI